MGRIGNMVRKDLLRQWRAPMAMLFVLAFPLVFAALMALAFGDGSPDAPTVTMLLEDRDDSMLSRMLTQSSGNEEMAKYFDVIVVDGDGHERMNRGEASALLVIPDGFGDALMRGESTTLELVRNPAQGILPEIAEQALRVAVDFLSSATRALRGPLDMVVAMEEAEEVDAEQVAQISTSVYKTINRSERLLFPPAITLKSVKLADADGTEADSGGPTRGLIFLIVLPGISVWALFLLGDMSMRDILTETGQGTLRRQLVSPVQPGEIVLAKALYTASLSLISLLLLATIGWLATGRTVDPLGFAVLSVCLITAVTGLASVIYGLATSERQGATVGSVLYLVFAFLGGAFIQVEALPASVRQVAPLSPFYWGTTGFQKMIRANAGVSEILPNAGVLLAIGVVGLILGSVLLGRKVNAGGVA